jgi:dUTP pyrophosphatase
MMNIELMREKTLLLMDPDSGYTQEDFNDEFGGNIPNHDYDYEKINVKFVNKSNNPDPKYSHEMDSGFDLRANLIEPITLKPLERKLVPTGLFFQLPNSYELQVRSRSGMALKNGVFVLNSPGTVDNKYTNEVCVILCNISNDNFTINHGDRIAQGVLSPISSTNIINLISVNSIEENNGRSNNGFGSTGVK